MTTPPELTNEEAETLRQQLAAHDAAENEAKKTANRARLAPLTALGLGGDGPLTCSLAELAAGLKTGAMTLGDLDPTLPNLAFSTAQVVETLNDRVRSLAAVNAAAPEPAATPPV